MYLVSELLGVPARAYAYVESRVNLKQFVERNQRSMDGWEIINKSRKRGNKKLISEDGLQLRVGVKFLAFYAADFSRSWRDVTLYCAEWRAQQVLFAFCRVNNLNEICDSLICSWLYAGPSRAGLRAVSRRVLYETPSKQNYCAPHRYNRQTELSWQRVSTVVCRYRKRFG